MKTFCFKLYHSEHNHELMRQINAAGLIYNLLELVAGEIARNEEALKFFHEGMSKLK